MMIGNATTAFSVAVELPEKQGLKLFLYRIKHKLPDSCSGTSRKTRIETFFKRHKGVGNNKLQWNFQKNKD